ncbi:MAG: YihY/virulence factor BrkB family protein [Bacteroidales bacterium]|nr:YihY/virulence factor BrkB family protein [Bacteroidales bacterium]
MSSVRPTPIFKISSNRILKILNFLKRINFPGFKKVKVFDVFSFFFKGLTKGALNIRATSIAFHFMLALGPAIIFILTLIPYMPVANFQENLMEILYDVIPEDSYIVLESILDSIFTVRHGLQIFGFLVTLFFVQKALNGIIEAFNASYHIVESRPWIERRLVSLVLFLILFILTTLSVILLFFNKVGIGYLYMSGFIKYNVNHFLIIAGKWLIITALTFFAISFLYYLAPARKTKWSFFSPGSIFATFFSIITSIVFSYFVNHFAPFNELYGSIGTLIGIMLWMNINSIVLLSGFELNASIYNAHFRLLNEPALI